MKRLHIAFLNLPRPVHINPTLSVVTALCRRGHRVTYCTSAEFEARVTSAGAEVVRVPRLGFKGEGMWKRRKVSDDAGEEDVADFPSLANRTLDHVLEFYHLNAPDLVIYDTFSYAGKLLAKKLGVPAVLATPQFAMDVPALRSQGLAPEFEDVLFELNDQCDRVHRQHGFRCSNTLFEKQPLNIYYFIREYQAPGVVDEPGTIYAGRCAPERPQAVAMPAFFDNQRPVAIVSTSTNFVQGADYYRRCAQALGEIGWRSILAPGGEISEHELNPLPAESVIAPSTPLSTIMPHANLIICLGGPATTMEALYHGLPLVLLSNGNLDAELYAQSVPRLGCGIHLEGNAVSSDRIKEAVLSVSNDPLAMMRVRELQAAVRNSLGPEEVANHIEEYHASSRYDATRPAQL